MRIVALVGDLLDRSKIAAAVPNTEFGATPDDSAGADVVVIDVKAHPEAVGPARKLAPKARIVAYGRHDNPGALDAALAEGADAALPRSRFFRNPAAAVTAALPAVARGGGGFAAANAKPEPCEGDRETEPEPETATGEDVAADDSA